MDKVQLVKYIFLSFFIIFPLFAQDSVKTRIISSHYRQFTIAAVGDLMCHSTQFKFAKVDKDSFDFKPVYTKVSGYLRNADLTMGNLETVIAEKGSDYKGYPVFNSPPDFLEALKYNGFDLLFTANNHILDRGEKGVLRTLDAIEKYGMDYSGSYKSFEDQDRIRIYQNDSIKVAILSYTYSTNGFKVPNDKEYLSSAISDSLVKRDIERASQLNPDAVIVYFHFGNEYETDPSPYQIDVVKNAISSGADIIIASHPHVLQPIQKFKSISGRIDSGFVAYSLGNFISNQRWRYSDCGVILNFALKKNVLTDSVVVSDLSVMPVWVYKGPVDGKNQYVILPSEIAEWDWKPEFLSKNDIKLMKESYDDSIEILKKLDKSIKIKKVDKDFINTIYLNIY